MLLLTLLAILPHTPAIQQRPADYLTNGIAHHRAVAEGEAARLGDFCSEPQPGVLRERCDLIEHNWFYDDAGRLVFDQLLFRDWHAGDGMFHIRGWRMVKGRTDDKKSIGDAPMLPRFSHAHGEWICEWLDGDIYRRVTAPVYRESWTQYDPELTEREYLPKEKRRELLSPKAVRK